MPDNLVTNAGLELADETPRALRATLVDAAGAAVVGTGGGAATVADGADVAEGALADAAVTAGGTGSLSAKLRAISRDTGALTETAPATDTASSGLNGRLQRIAQRLTSIIALLPTALGQGTMATSFKVVLPSDQTAIPTTTKGYTSGKVSVTRTADTNAYTANDVLGPATGSTAALTFPTMGPSGGGEIIITSATFERDATALISGETSYTLHLYNVTPPSALGDNVAFDLPSGDRTAYLGSINLGTPVDLGSTLYIATDAINKQITLASGSLFGYLVTTTGYTPASAAVHLIALHAVGC